MKLNTKKTLIICIIILLSYYHFYIHNKIEKLFSKSYFNYDYIRRPLAFCDNKNNHSKLYCIGMPSGHAETYSLLCFLLYFYRIIPLWICLIIIFMVLLQRVISYKHTIIQVLIGSLLGFLYANIYKYFNLSIYGFLIVITIGFTLMILSLYKINKNSNEIIIYNGY